MMPPDAVNISPPPLKPGCISELMRRLATDATHEETVSVGSILHTFGVRGFAFLLLILSLLNIVIFMIPFVSFFFGLPMIILTAQMVIGLKTPILPQIIRRQTIKRATLTRGLETVILWVEKIERYIKPRLSALSDARFDRVHGLLLMILSIMVTLPIPLFNVPPSLAIAALAIGIMQRDGYFIGTAYALGFWCFMLFRSLGHLAHSLAS